MDSWSQELSQALWGLGVYRTESPVAPPADLAPPLFCHPRTETVVEKLLTNWMSICLYTFVRVREAEVAGAPL